MCMVGRARAPSSLNRMAFMKSVLNTGVFETSRLGISKCSSSLDVTPVSCVAATITP